jgi:hypothetical protein
MPNPFGSDFSRLPLAGIALLSVALLAVGCTGKSPLAFLKPQPAASKKADPKPAAAPNQTASKKADPKPATAPNQTASKKVGPRKADPKKAQPLTPEQLATAPLRPSDRLGPGYWIQLAAHFKAQGGAAAWKTLSARHPGLLGGEAHAIKRVDLGGRGRFYRLLVGPYAARRPAQEKCARLKRAKVACFLITQYGRTRGTPVAGAPKTPAPKTVEPKPPATAVPAAAVKPGKSITPRKAAITATPALVKPAPRPPAKTTEKKTGTPAARQKRGADLPFQRSEPIPGMTK